MRFQKNEEQKTNARQPILSCCTEPYPNKQQFEFTADTHLTSPFEWSLLGSVCVCACSMWLRTCGGGLVVVVSKQHIAGCGAAYPCISAVPRFIHSERRDKNHSRQSWRLLSSSNIALSLLYLALRFTNFSYRDLLQIFEQ